MDTSKLRAEFLDEVKQAVCQDRTKYHGQPEDNFKNIAWLWTGWLRGRHRLDVSLDVLDVGYMSILLKVARAESNPRHLDHATDSAGYAACVGGELKNEEMREKSPMGKLTPKQVDALLHAGDSATDRWSNMSDRLADELREMREKSPVPEPKPEFKATHIADNLDLARLVSTDGGSVKYETQDDCLATVSREYFFSVFRPLSEKVPGSPAATAIPGGGVGGSGAVTMGGGAGGSVQTCTSVATGWERVVSSEVPPPTETGGLVEPWKPTHQFSTGSYTQRVRVLEQTESKIRYETEDRCQWNLLPSQFNCLFRPIPE